MLAPTCGRLTGIDVDLPAVKVRDWTASVGLIGTLHLLLW